MMSDSGKSFKVQIKHWEPTVEESGVPYVNFRSGNLVELLKVNSMDSVFIRSREKQHLNIFFSAWNSVAIHCYENCNYNLLYYLNVYIITNLSVANIFTINIGIIIEENCCTHKLKKNAGILCQSFVWVTAHWFEGVV